MMFANFACSTQKRRHHSPSPSSALRLLRGGALDPPRNHPLGSHPEDVMHRMPLALLSLLCLAACAAAAAAGSACGFRPTSLRVNSLEDPLGTALDGKTAFSWALVASVAPPMKGAVQTAYRIECSSKGADGPADLWVSLSSQQTIRHFRCVPEVATGVGRRGFAGQRQGPVFREPSDRVRGQGAAAFPASPLAAERLGRKGGGRRMQHGSGELRAGSAGGRGRLGGGGVACTVPPGPTERFGLRSVPGRLRAHWPPFCCAAHPPACNGLCGQLVAQQTDSGGAHRRQIATPPLASAPR